MDRVRIRNNYSRDMRVPCVAKIMWVVVRTMVIKLNLVVWLLVQYSEMGRWRVMNAFVVWMDVG